MRVAALRGPYLLPVALFFGTFAWSFVYVSLPFHIQRMSRADAVTTLQWTGWILGITPLVTVLTAPVWGRYAGRGNPKGWYVLVEVLQAIAFVGMALARTLPELLLARFVLGFMGAASTFAFIIAGRAADPAEVRRQVAAVQSAMTVGQVLGPLAGAIAAAQIGFRPSFILGSLILFGCASLVRWGVPSPVGPAAARAVERRTRWRDVAATALVVLAGSTQVFFLAAILPQILPDLGVAAGKTLEMGGFLLFASGVAAAVGAMATPRLGEVFSERRLVATLLVTSSLFLAALAAVSSVWVYGVVRFLQVLSIAPVFPLVVARIAQNASGEAIGVVNSARIGAAFVGPVVATSLLAWTSPLVLYVGLGLLGVACVPLAAVRERALPRGTA
ncbi:MAG: MFS transporter [Candidatus Rokubacteria bacterium]|nr:MFS transporter [Candidatus Rokubacteria bacterium]